MLNLLNTKDKHEERALRAHHLDPYCRPLTSRPTPRAHGHSACTQLDTHAQQVLIHGSRHTAYHSGSGWPTQPAHPAGESPRNGPAVGASACFWLEGTRRWHTVVTEHHSSSEPCGAARVAPARALMQYACAMSRRPPKYPCPACMAQQLSETSRALRFTRR